MRLLPDVEAVGSKYFIFPYILLHRGQTQLEEYDVSEQRHGQPLPYSLQFFASVLLHFTPFPQRNPFKVNVVSQLVLIIVVNGVVVIANSSGWSSI